MRLVGGLVFVVFAIATAYAILATDRRSRPADVAFAIAAPLAAIIALIGLALFFVPGLL